MTFNSYLFLLLLPGVVLVSASLSRWVRFQNLFLLAFSLFFYGYWDWRFLLLLGATVLVDYTVALRISASASPASRRRWLWVSLVSNLGLLGAFKYYDFFAAGLSTLLASVGLGVSLPLLKVVLPIGISFYTFQSLSYTLDVYWGRMPPVRRLTDFALFVSFFPHLVAGPIMLARDLIPQLERPKRPSAIQVREGAFLVLYGLFQKVVIADTAASIVDYVYIHMRESGWILLLAGAVAFSLQIYGDFAGYSNIARGCAKLLGVELMINFANPYLSTSITEFWRRWHISLSTWLRDYLYVPLGGNRLGFRRACLNLMIVMLLGGLWHGANWTFVVWGGLHGLYLVIHKLLLRRGVPQGTGPVVRVLKGLGIFLLVSLTWVFFRAPSLPVGLEYLGGILTLQSGGWQGLTFQVLVIAGVLLPFEVVSRFAGDDLRPLAWRWPVRGLLYACLAWLVFGGIGAQRTFIYFQF